MSPLNLVGGPVLIILLLFLSAPPLLGQNLSTAGYFPTSAAPQDAPLPAISPTTLDDLTNSPLYNQDAPVNPDQGFILLPTVMVVSTTAPPPTSSAPAYMTKTTAAEELKVSNVVSSSPVSTVVRPDVVTSTIAATLTTSESPASVSIISSTEEPGLLATTTLNPIAEVTSLPPATEKSLTTAIDADAANSPTSEDARTSPRSTTEPTSTTSSLTGAITPITPPVMTGRYSTQLPPLTTPDATSNSVLVPQKNDRPPWLVVIVILAVVIFVGGVLAYLFIRCRRRSGVKRFGPGVWSSQRFKRKGRAEDDAWAGPVMATGLEGREECDGGEVGHGPEKKEGDGEDLVLSTFLTDDERQGPGGGVGRKGSKEVEKWEQEAPLLYIDESAGEENETPKGANKSDAKGERERNGGVKERGEIEKGEGGELSSAEEMNGGNRFCLITAV